MSDGVSIGQILTRNAPWPTYILKWGENMPPHILQALKAGEAALLVRDGEVHSMIVYNSLVGFREMSVATMREYNRRNHDN